MWRRQEHIFPRGYLGVVSLGKACSWGGVGGRKWHLSCPTMYLVLGSGTHSNCLSASSSTAGGISASGSSGVGSVGRPIRDMSRARKLRVDTVPIQREPQNGQAETNMGSGGKVGRTQAQHFLGLLEASQLLTPRVLGQPSSTWL